MRRETFLEARSLAEVALGDVLDLSWTPWRWIALSAADPQIRCLVDAEDYDWLSENVWNVWHAGGRNDWQWYAKRNVGERRATVRMHREIMIRAEPHDEAFIAAHVVDHVNGQTLDNRKANLRWSTKRGNVFNRRARGLAPSLDEIVRCLIAGLEPRAVLEEVPF